MKCTFSEIDPVQLRLVAFDLDDTLAPSKTPLPAKMSQILHRLLQRHQVCIISGGQLEQFQTQVLDHLDLETQAATRHVLHLMPTCGTQYYRLHPATADLETCYRQDLDPRLRIRTAQALEKSARELGLWEENPWGDIIEDRGTQVTFSALGQAAPLEAKRAWDPDGSKKQALATAVAREVPELEVRGGGSTSVDVTAKGIDKAYGIRALLQATALAPHQVLFVGDRLDPQGNDYPVVSTSVPCQAVTGWEDTVALLTDLLK